MENEDKEHHEHHEHEKAHEHHESKEEHHQHAKEEAHEHEKKHEHTHEPPSGEKKELSDGRISMIVFTLAGIAMAFASTVLKAAGLSNYITVTLGLIFLIVFMGVMQKSFKRKTKFFLGPALAYLFVWLVFWILFFNMW